MSVAATADPGAEIERTPADPGGARPHLAGLDGLRGLAVLGVMLRHFVEDMHPTNAVDHALHYTLRLGSCGVDLFFVLSGFLITDILLSAKGGPRYFTNFYARRTLRIFPLYYLALALAFYVLPIFHWEDRRILLFNHASEYKPWYWTYTANILFALKGAYQGLTCVWSLCIEEQFYLVWPLVVLVSSRRGLIKVAVACIAAAVALRFAWHFWAPALVAPLTIPGADASLVRDMSNIGPYVLTPMRMDSLAVGAILAAVGQGPSGLAWAAAKARWIAAGCIAIPGAILAATWGTGRNPALMLVGATPLAVFFGMAVVVAATAGPGTLAHRVFGNRVLRFFGKYSYSLYIFHGFVLELADQFMTQDDVPRIHGVALPGMLLYIAVLTGASVLVSMTTWHFFEAPILSLKRFFAYERPGRASSGEPGTRRLDTHAISSGRSVRPREATPSRTDPARVLAEPKPTRAGPISPSRSAPSSGRAE